MQNHKINMSAYADRLNIMRWDGRDMNKSCCNLEIREYGDSPTISTHFSTSRKSILLPNLLGAKNWRLWSNKFRRSGMIQTE